MPVDHDDQVDLVPTDGSGDHLWRSAVKDLTLIRDIHTCVPSVRLRKPGCAGFSAIRTPKIFNPVVEDDHPSNMSLRQDGSSQLSCHNQTDPVPSFVGRCPLKNSKTRQRGILAKRRSKSFSEDWLPSNDPTKSTR